MSHVTVRLNSGSIHCATLQASTGRVPPVVLSEGRVQRVRVSLWPWRSANPPGWFGKGLLQRPALLTWLWWLMGQNWISSECEGGALQWELWFLSAGSPPIIAAWLFSMPSLPRPSPQYFLFPKLVLPLKLETSLGAIFFIWGCCMHIQCLSRILFDFRWP